MKIDLSLIDRQQFNVKEGDFCGVKSFLVTPALQGTKWTQQNKHLRSSVWDAEGNLISASFPKFTNLGESPEHFPVPESLDGCEIIIKKDGSTLICDYFNDRFNCRSRGTFDFNVLDSAQDLKFILEKYPQIEPHVKCNNHLSYIFEIYQPSNKIIINYGTEPKIWLIGAIVKKSYGLAPQDVLDVEASLMEVPRPEYFEIDSIESLISHVKPLVGEEGYCIYSRNGQQIHKLKADLYLRLHRAKSQIGSISNLLDLWFEYERPNHQDFYKKIGESLDFELAEMSREDQVKICDAAILADDIVKQCKPFVKNLSGFSRKDAAQQVLEGPLRAHAGILFNLLDGKEVSDKMYRKLIEQLI